ncbi:hypothetical protein HK097_003945 [Rhizophlyctis rosea]|uniref:NAD(P)-binding domain-containing protein n=1 Tax=Rhizophlyctis rosea TaxID=64517 RepID=A0AAD5SM92_9FUNG|nr:hypothetical protein HK097_003945 [Rhizophlyctis rosea]
MRVLLVGGTGSVGQKVLEELLNRNVEVRAVVRSTASLSPEIKSNPKLELITASLLKLSDEKLQGHVKDCDVVISTLGHRVNWKGIPLLGVWMPPYSLVTLATTRLCTAIQHLPLPHSTKFIQLSTVGIANPSGTDTHVPTTKERLITSIVKPLTPPWKDSASAAAYLANTIGTENRFIEWVAVRPDALVDDTCDEYEVYDSVRHAFYEAEVVGRKNIARFIAELCVNEGVWERWKGKMPVIIDKVQPAKK